MEKNVEFWRDEVKKYGDYHYFRSGKSKIHQCGHFMQAINDVLVGGAILDIGCGTGQNTSELIRSTRMIVAADPAKEAVRLGAQRFPDITFVVSNGCNIPFNDKSFDSVVLAHVLHHVYCPLKLIRECARVARKQIVIVDPNRLCPARRYKERFLYKKDEEEKSYHLITIENVLGRAGMTVHAIQYLGFIPDFTSAFILPFMSRLEMMLESLPFIQKVSAAILLDCRFSE